MAESDSFSSYKSHCHPPHHGQQLRHSSQSQSRLRNPGPDACGQGSPPPACVMGTAAEAPAARESAPPESPLEQAAQAWRRGFLQTDAGGRGDQLFSFSGDKSTTCLQMVQTKKKKMCLSVCESVVEIASQRACTEGAEWYQLGTLGER